MTGFTTVFGGSPVQPAQVAYRAFNLTTNVTLFWPQQSVDTTDVVARWNSVGANLPSLTITLGPATNISPGQDAVFANTGTNSFTLAANDGSTIATIATGVVIYVINADNSTVAGSWTTVAFGATTSSADAVALAGAGLIAAATKINQNYVTSPHNSNYTVVTGDLATLILWTGGVGTITLPDPAAIGAGFFIMLDNQGSGALTVSPAAGMIDAASTKTYNQTESSFIISDGANWYSMGFGRSVTVSFTQLVKSVAGSTDVTLTSAEAANQVQQYTGILTGNINVIVPTNVAEYFVFNNTSGAFTLTVKTAAGTGIAVAQATRTILLCDGTNVVNAINIGSGTVTNIATGTGLTGGPITTTGTVALANTAVTPGTYTLATLTVDQQGRLTAASNGSASGTGTVTSVATGTGLTGGPITTTGTVALANTAVTPGAYTNANITVDQQGRLTAAASGSTSGLPSGVIMDFAGSSVPSGWLICDGSAVSRATYPDLFTAIGTTYGAGNGSTTFNVPDYRGRIGVGKDNMGGSTAGRITAAVSGITGTTLGATGGEQGHTLVTAEMPAHTHSVSNLPSSNIFDYGTGGSRVGGTATSTNTGSTGGGGTHNNVQPTIIVNKIIKT